MITIGIAYENAPACPDENLWEVLEMSLPEDPRAFHAGLFRSLPGVRPWLAEDGEK
jgi:hypothetical protein